MITRLFVPSARNRDIGTLTYNTDYHFRCFARCGRILSLPCWNEHKRNRSVLHERSRSKCLKRSSESSGRLHLRPRSSFARSLRGLLFPFEWHEFPTFSDYFANHHRLHNWRSCLHSQTENGGQRRSDLLDQFKSRLSAKSESRKRGWMSSWHLREIL